MPIKTVYKWVWDNTRGKTAERRLADKLILNLLEKPER